MTLPDRFAAHLASLQLARGRALVAVSGGSDSLALLHLLQAAGPPQGLDLVVAHADHGIHPESAAVAARVEAVAERLGLPVRVGRLALGPETSEADARRERYRWLRATLQAHGARHIFLAHHREDQAETVLMRVLAGSGPAGLSGMAPMRGTLVRPLLPFGREELRAYLAEVGWPAWQDPANAAPRHTRSWIRTAVMPILAAREPEVTGRLVRVAAHAEAARGAWDAVLDALPELAVRMEGHAVSVAARPLSGYDSRLSRAVIQALGRRADLVVGAGAAAAIGALAARGRSGAWLPLAGGGTAEIAFGRLRLAGPATDPLPDERSIGGLAPGTESFGRWRVTWVAEPAPLAVSRDGWSSWFIPGAYRVRRWRPGDRIRPLGGAGGRLVVRCLQDARVPRADRARWPMVTSAGGDDVLWVPGICRGEASIPSSGTEAVRIDVNAS